MKTFYRTLKVREARILNQLEKLKSELDVLHKYMALLEKGESIKNEAPPHFEIPTFSQKLSLGTEVEVLENNKLTIKDMTKKVLASRTGGMTATQIIEQIKAEYGVDLPRTSLSPQLSRLKQEGVLVDHAGIWSLVNSNSQIVKSDKNFSPRRKYTLVRRTPEMKTGDDG